MSKYDELDDLNDYTSEPTGCIPEKWWLDDNHVLKTPNGGMRWAHWEKQIWCGLGNANSPYADVTGQEAHDQGYRYIKPLGKLTAQIK